MAKIVLGARPKSFKKVVSVPMLDGEDGLIECEFKYRTSEEFGALLDEMKKAAEEKADAEKARQEAERKKAEEAGETYVEPEFSFEQIRAEQNKANADYLMNVIDGWNLDVPFTADAVLQLCNELPAAPAEIGAVYRAAIVEGRLGN